MGRATAPKAHRDLCAFTVAWGRSPAPTLLSLPINNLPPISTARNLFFLTFSLLCFLLFSLLVHTWCLKVCLAFGIGIVYFFFFILLYLIVFISYYFVFVIYLIYFSEIFSYSFFVRIYLMDFGHDLFLLDGLVYIYFIYITIKSIFAAFIFFLVFISFSVFNFCHYH